jgi:DNA-directed RNA polymerase subunit RPC12/RpoP
MTESFRCPNCGAPLHLKDETATTVRCEHCGASVVVPQSARRQPTPLVIRIGERIPGASLAPGARTAVVILVVAIVVGSAAVGIAGLVLGLGAAAVTVRLPSDPPGVDARQDDGTAAPLQAFGGSGIGAGLFTDARSIGLDGEGRIYVGEYQGGRVQAFDQSGGFLAQWFADREVPLTGMAVARDGRVFTVQGGAITVRAGLTGEAEGRLSVDGGDNFEDVAVMADGGLLTAWYRNRDDLVVFDHSGSMVLTVSEAVSGQTGESELSLRVASDGRGDLWVLGEFHQAVFHFGPDGRFLNRIGSGGSQPGQFQAPSALALDGQGRIYVGDVKGVQIFEPDGRYVEVIPIEGFPFGIALDASDHVWVVNGTRVFEFGPRP